MNKIKDILENTGYYIVKDLIDENLVKEIKKDIFEIKNVSKYKDRLGNLRRIEKIYDKSNNLIILDKLIRKQLNNIYSEDFIIFKDKYNAKPPNGEGFYSHYDGIFEWKDTAGKIRNGWYEYANFFMNVLIALDECNEKNGSIEISKIHNYSFDELLDNTKKNGTPDLKTIIEKECVFETILLNPGDIVFFSNKCPHRSAKNISSTSRMTLYYTYNKLFEGDNYKKYFEDKENSKNKTSKSLSGQI